MRQAVLASLLLIVAMMAVGTARAQALGAGECRIPEAERERLLALDIEAFDRTASGGWRPWFEAGCLADTAALIEAYMAAHPDHAGNDRELHFHAAQVHAFRGDYAAARAHLRHASYPEDRRDPSRPDAWNVYMRATDAFLARDRDALAGIYRQMGGEDEGEAAAEPHSLFGPPPRRRKRMPYLDVVRGLLACFDRPYGEAYDAACRAQ
ncbi:MAG: hypothetical protein D6807_06000 [Alphaproteobacteria bacterium]|nr:MAG: hypothetical protein D6807_06000 [Alphaproteobacteria bacterium]